ncbi:hypothetical protein H257_02440 [Aphanomyces astaci]|uniref:Protein ENHANCED DISEASE RESISTANCE 2 C-terminal domain-containing protein n=1 Tax=Aphanomyces astaci TaxID=112090 RepID=W4H2S8_APHAT|nr:hypothetical protein H257_02440 [Aphanomyces astaci]ETV85911.1 hypothetical protein H257_02440 [Aphanomyces astaci]|eukprot:XP_009824383.1 hypothetical protein H257_02440 [Aphanomyces astaci]
MFGLPSATSSKVLLNELLLWVTSALPPLPKPALSTRPLRMSLRPPHRSPRRSASPASTMALAIMLVVVTVALVIMTVTPAVLLMMPSPVTLATVILQLLRSTPSYHHTSSLNRILEKPHPLSVLPIFFTTGSAPLIDVFASPPRPSLPSTSRSFLLSLPRLCHMHQLLSSRTRCQPTTRLLRLLRLCHSRQLPLSRPRCQPTTGLALMQEISTSLKSHPTRFSSPIAYHSTHRDHYFTSQPTQPKWIFHCSHKPIKVVLQLPPQCVDGIRPHPPFQVIKGNGFFALHADLRYCEHDVGSPPLPKAVTYGPTNFPALREHWIVDSGASTSCTPNRYYFLRYVPCALSLTVGNGTTLPVVDYGAISMLVDMSSRDQVDDIRPYTLRLDFGLHI